MTDQNRDQAQLFDQSTTERKRCPHCQAAARNACEHDANIANGTTEPLTRRPRGCISSAQLSHDDPFPEGF